MRCVPLRILNWPAVLLLAASFTHMVAATVTPSPADLAALAHRVKDITEAVLRHHVEPPARQQMFLAGIRAVYNAAKVPVPSGLARRVSGLSTDEQFAAFLEESWPRTSADQVALQDALIEGLVQSIPGGASLVSAKEHKVNEQFGGNRYVGLHIALAFDKTVNRPTIGEAFEGGPADRAGVKKGDLLEEIDGVDTKGLALAAAVDRLRGEEGTAVVIKVRQPGSAEARTLRIVRGTLPHPTIMGFHERAKNDWDFRIDSSDPIAYMLIERIIASTPHELRQIARRLEAEGTKGLVLDLRRLARADLHSTVLLADCLLDGGIIGRARTADGVVTYRAEPDARFHDIPMVVLVNPYIEAPGQWFAAALEDNKRAQIIVTNMIRLHSPFQPHVSSAVPVGDGAWWLTLTTGLLERADGRPIAFSASREDQHAATPRQAAGLNDQHDENVKHMQRPAAPSAGLAPPKTETDLLREQLAAVQKQSHEYKLAQNLLNQRLRSLERGKTTGNVEPNSADGEANGSPSSSSSPFPMPPDGTVGQPIRPGDRDLQQALDLLHKALKTS